MTLPGWLEAMLPFRRSTVRAGDVAVHVMEQDGAGARAGSPPVLLLHGNPTWGFLWRKVAAALADAPLRLVMPDLVGLGLSDKPRDPAWHTLERHAAAIGAVIDQLGLEGLILVGQDWGGPIGLRALADRRERLAGLVLCNTVVGPPRPGFRPRPFHRFAALPVVPEIVFRGLGFPQNLLALAQGDRSSIRGDVARAYRWPLRRIRDRVAPLALARMVPGSLDHPSVPALARCHELVSTWTGPAALVWGDRDPILGSAKKHVARLLPHAEVTSTAAGHFLQEEVPEAIAAAIRKVAAGA